MQVSFYCIWCNYSWLIWVETTACGARGFTHLLNFKSVTKKCPWNISSEIHGVDTSLPPLASWEILFPGTLSSKSIFQNGEGSKILVISTMLPCTFPDRSSKRVIRCVSLWAIASFLMIDCWFVQIDRLSGSSDVFLNGRSPVYDCWLVQIDKRVVRCTSSWAIDSLLIVFELNELEALQGPRYQVLSTTFFLSWREGKLDVKSKV